MFCAGFLVDADHLGGPGGVEGANLAWGFEALAGNDKIVLSAQLAGYGFQR
jgi:hypothetical protein